MAGLLTGLGDARFEVRYRCGKALARLRARDSDAPVDRKSIRAAVLKEATASPAVWKSRKLLDEAPDVESTLVDSTLELRVNRSLEHVFRLLTLLHPVGPMVLAFRALHTSDRELRGTALEYLSVTLRDDVREALWPFFDADMAAEAVAVAPEEALDKLMATRASVLLDLSKLQTEEGE